MESIKGVWELQNKSINKSVLRHHIAQIKSIPVYLGTIAISNTKFLLLEVRGTRELHEKRLQKFRGVELQWLPQTETKGEIVLLLTEPDLISTFTMLVEDIIHELESAQDESEALNLFYSVITNWRRIFDRIKPTELSLTQQIGLYGELLTMKLLQEAGLTPKSVLSAWTGPEKSQQRFFMDQLWN